MVLLFVITAPLIGNAQTIEKLEAKGYHPKFTPNENSIIVSESKYSRLEKFDLDTKEQTLIVEGQSIAYRAFSTDKDVYIRENGKVKKINFETKKKSDFNLNISPKASALTNELKKNMGKKSSKKAVDVIPNFNIDGFIVIYSDGSKLEFSPQGKNAIYIDATLSPDGSKVVYTGPDQSYVLNLNKNNAIIPIGHIEAPSWAGNNNIVFMRTKDDGDYYTSSDIFSINLNSKEVKKYTNGFNELAMYPSSNNDMSKILFNTDKGDVYQITTKN